jgi:putative hemolysin
MEILVIFLLIVLNGIFSMSEIAIVSSRRTRLEEEVKEGRPGAAIALQLADEPNRFLSTVQIGMTLIGIVTGVFGGERIARRLAPLIAKVSLLAPYSQPIALTLVVLVITFLSLVIGELVPKRVGMHRPERIARLVARPMAGLSRITRPFVWLLSQSTELLLKVFRLRPSQEPEVSEQEVRSLIGHGTQEGVFEEIEQDIIGRVFTLSDRKVGSVMTNRIDLKWIDAQAPLDAILTTIATSPEYVFLLANEHIDQVVGIVNTRKILSALLTGKPLQLADITEQPLFVPQAMDAFRALELLKGNPVSAAVVVDEFGTVQGLLTLGDLFAAMVGEVEHTGRDEKPIVVREDGSCLVDALLPLEEFIHHFKVAVPGEAERGDFHTVGGLLIHLAREIPKTGDRFTWQGYQLEVLDMDRTRIDKVLVTSLAESQTHDG